MFYKTEIQDHVRVPPSLFNLSKDEAVLKQVKQDYAGYISQDLGIVIDVSEVTEVGEGIVIPGDGASYYQTTFKILTFKPEMQEIVMGRIKDIADFGAFISIGPIEGMIHISQTMDDFVSFAKDKSLAGKDTKRTLKVGDECKARIIAVSFKDLTNPKIGLTMRQAGLGRLDWIEDDLGKTGEKASQSKENKESKK
ncbi:DNA-directed RNA polymerase [Candidatus Woesearchaeota archaeon]|nr:DNA-directed RNA polymerase [Candidatus Woesearchaeota archaeon]